MKRNETNTTTQIQVIVRTRDNASGKIVGDSSTFSAESGGYLGKTAREKLAHSIIDQGRQRLLDAVNGLPGPARN